MNFASSILKKLEEVVFFNRTAVEVVISTFLGLKLKVF
jgi:hypothetical protein